MLLVSNDAAYGCSEASIVQKPKAGLKPTHNGPGMHQKVEILRHCLISELNEYCGKYTTSELLESSWPKSVAERWIGLNAEKSKDDLGLLSWNVNGRLELLAVGYSKVKITLLAVRNLN